MFINNKNDKLFKSFLYTLMLFYLIKVKCRTNTYMLLIYYYIFIILHIYNVINIILLCISYLFIIICLILL